MKHKFVNSRVPSAAMITHNKFMVYIPILPKVCTNNDESDLIKSGLMNLQVPALSPLEGNKVCPRMMMARMDSGFSFRE